MRVVRITDSSMPEFDWVYGLYQTAFPIHEQRSREGLIKALSFEKFRMEAWYDGGEIIGLLQWWDYPGFAYVEHLAVDSSKRGGGYGEQILRSLMKEDRPPVVLEIDPLVDEVSERRWGFYRRLGFVMNPYKHIHVPYENRGNAFELLILSWPGMLTEEQYNVFYTEHRHRIIPLVG